MASPPNESGYSQLVNNLIKHPRYYYNDPKLKGFFQVDGEMFIGEEFSVQYKPGVNLAMSVMTRLTPKETDNPGSTKGASYFPRPAGCRNVLLYLHTHQGARMEGTYLTDFVVNYECSLAVIDFAGAGVSQGDYTSFGWFESDQVQSVVNFLNSRLGFESIGIWGKSMGAVAALLFQSKYQSPLVKFLVIDSAFDKLKHAVLNIAQSHSAAPAFAIKAFLLFIANSVKTKAKFDVYKVNPIDHVPQVKIPTIFVIGQQDDVVKPNEFFKLHAKCGAQYKKLFVAKGDHTANRLEDEHFRQEMVTFVGHFFPMRKRADEIIGVLINKSMVPLIRSNISQGPDSTAFDYTKVKNSIFMPRNDNLRMHTVTDSHLQPHLSVMVHPLTSHIGESYGQTLAPPQTSHQPSTTLLGSPLAWTYGGGTYAAPGQTPHSSSSDSRSPGSIV